jgi:hypothetical protein
MRIAGPFVLSWSVKEVRVPVFYFNVCDGHNTIEDPEGTVLPDVEAALSEAKMVARELVIYEVESGRRVDGRTIEVVDGEGVKCVVMAIREIVD